jgi:dTDP-4-amino-4,6-dideoxygalactose transaminase
MTRLDAFVERRHALARRYTQCLAGLPLTLPYSDPQAFSALHLYAVRLRPSIAKSRRQVFDELRARGIGVNVHYIPVHTQPYYQRRGFREGDFPQAEQYYREAISLPLFYGLTEGQQDQVVGALREVLA